MGTSRSEELRECNNPYQQIGSVSMHHLGEVPLFYDQLTHQKFIKPHYEFALDSERENEFIAKLRFSNNKCPFLVSIQKIEVEKRSNCTHNHHLYHVYFEYLPMTLSMYLAMQQDPLPDGEVKLLVGCLLEAVRDMNERGTYHGDIYPEYIYLDERG